MGAILELGSFIGIRDHLMVWVPEVLCAFGGLHDIERVRVPKDKSRVRACTNPSPTWLTHPALMALTTPVSLDTERDLEHFEEDIQSSGIPEPMTCLSRRRYWSLALCKLWSTFGHWPTRSLSFPFSPVHFSLHGYFISTNNPPRVRQNLHSINCPPLQKKQAINVWLDNSILSYYKHALSSFEYSYVHCNFVFKAQLY